MKEDRKLKRRDISRGNQREWNGRENKRKENPKAHFV